MDANNTQRITITVNDVAEMIGCHKDTVYNMCREKQIPHTRVRHRILFKRDAIERWIEQGGTSQGVNL